MVVLRLAILVWLSSFLLACSKKEEAATGPVPVTVIVAEPREMPAYVEYVGETEAPQTVEVRSKVEGFLERVSYTEAGLVNQGQVLFTIDQRPFFVAVTQAKADLAKAEAHALRSKQDLARIRPLAAQDAVSKAELDAVVAKASEADASVEAARAQVRQAEIDLGYCTISSPISGRADRSLMKVGSFIAKGSTLLTTVSSIDPIWVNFRISEREYLDAMRRRSEAGLRSEPSSFDTTIALSLVDGTLYPQLGFINLIDRAIDLKTGTLGIRCQFPNAQHLLRPGQYARVRIQVGKNPTAVPVPQRAITEVQGKRFVVVVNKDGTVAQRPVVTGARIGPLWVIEQGLSSGDQVVVEGLLKLRPGTKVKPTVVTLESLTEQAKGN